MLHFHYHATKRQIFQSYFEMIGSVLNAPEDSGMRKILVLLMCIASPNAFCDTSFDLSTIKEGQYDSVTWKNLPIFIFHRTQSQIEHLSRTSTRAANTAPSKYKRMYGIAIASAVEKGNEANSNGLRSLDDKWFIVLGHSPEIGVILRVYVNEGVMMDPSDGTHYDLTGRVIDKNSTKKDLSIPHYEISGNNLTIFDGMSDEEVRKSIENFQGTLEEKVQYVISNNDYDTLNTMLNQNPTLIKSANVNLMVLVAVTIYGEKEVLDTAIKNGADINIVFKNGTTPLISALMADNIEIAEHLFRNGASIERFCDKNDPTRCSAPTLAVAKNIPGAEEVVKSWMQKYKSSDVEQ